MQVILCAVIAALSFEIIDRVAVTIDEHVITESDVRQEIRVAAFLDGTQPDFSGPSKRAAAERLVDQYLMRREMQFTRYPQPASEEIDEQMKQIRARSKTEAAYRAALEEVRVTDAQVRDAVQRAIAVVQFIDLRFRPEVQVTEPELMEYFTKQCLPEWKKTHTGPDPTFDELRSQCEDKMTAERVDARVETWLKEARSRTRIRFEEDAFR